MPAPDVEAPMVNGLPPQSGPAATLAAVISALSNTSFAGRRRTINGAGRIDQANEGAAVVVNNATTFYGADKHEFFGTAAAGVFSAQRLSATPPPGFTNYTRLTVTTADAAPAAAAQYFWDHRISGALCSDLQFGVAGNSAFVTRALWVRSSVAGVFSGALQNDAGNRSYVFTFTIVAANVWQLVTFTAPVDNAGVWVTTTGHIGLLLRLDLGCGANSRNATAGWQAAQVQGQTGAVSLLATNGATFDFTGDQLEPGIVATPFEAKSDEVELADCQMEFIKSFAQGTAPAQGLAVNTGEQGCAAAVAGVNPNFMYVNFPRVMVKPPAITTFCLTVAGSHARDETAAANCSGEAVANATDRGFVLSFNGAAGTVVGNRIGVHFTADARI